MAQRILVVDDDPDTLTLIGLTLQRRGFEVLKAQSGQQALNLLTHDMPDLVILDVMMPQMDGYEVCREIKAQPRIAHLPIVMLTAKAQTASQLEGFRAGAIDYITKPVHPQDLVKRIQSVLDKTAQGQPPLRAQLITVLGVKGGVGATTLAVNIALALAADQHTVFVDMEPGGSAALQLGLEGRGLNVLVADESTVLDGPSVEAALSRHSSGLRVLSAAEQSVTTAQATVIANLMQGLCDVCVFDLGWGATPVSRVITPRSTAVLLVIDADKATLLQANRLLQTLTETGVPADAVKIVWVNRQAAPVDIAQPAIRAALGREPVAMIDSASEAMYLAMESARPLVLSQPDSPVAQAIKSLARSLLPAPQTA